VRPSPPVARPPTSLARARPRRRARHAGPAGRVTPPRSAGAPPRARRTGPRGNGGAHERMRELRPRSVHPDQAGPLGPGPGCPRRVPVPAPPRPGCRRRRRAAAPPVPRGKTPNCAAITPVSRSFSGSGSAAQRRPAAGSLPRSPSPSSISLPAGLPVACASTCSRARPARRIRQFIQQPPASAAPNCGRISFRESGRTRSERPYRAPRAAARAARHPGAVRRRRACPATRGPALGVVRDHEHRAALSQVLTAPVSSAIPVSRASGGTGSGASPNALSSARACRSGRVRDPVEHRPQQLVQPGEGQVAFGLRPVTVGTSSPRRPGPPRHPRPAGRSCPCPARPPRPGPCPRSAAGPRVATAATARRSRPINPISVLAKTTPRTQPNCSQLTDARGRVQRCAVAAWNWSSAGRTPAPSQI